MFDKKWFLQNQKLFRWFANTKYGRSLLGHGLDKVDLILPNAVIKKEGKQYIAEFRTHDKYSKRLFYEFKPLWYAFHWFDMNIANVYVPKLNLGFDGITTYPVAGSNSPIDGIVIRQGVDEVFGTIRAGAGNATSDSGDNSEDSPALVSSTNSNQFQGLRRSVYLFDTSSLTSSADISSAVASVYGNSSSTKANQMGSQDWHWCASTPAANNALVSADYGQLGATSFGTITYAAFTGGQYNDSTLNASGVAAISKTGITKLGARLSDDINGTFTGVWGSGLQDSFRPVFADHTGIDQDPKLVVNFTLPGGSRSFFM